jgi:ribonuclease III
MVRRDDSGLGELEDGLGHVFADGSYLRAALVHRSYTSEHAGVPHNERLEFLGDAVLQLAVTHHLFETFPHLSEGEMAKARAACVNRAELAQVARGIGVGGHLRMGLGERQSGGADKDSILADCMEAILAAVYLDGGYEAARGVVLRHWESTIVSKSSEPGRRDFKTRYQELVAARGKRPNYTVTGEGPDHARMFTAVLDVEGRIVGTGTGRSKKEAEQAAARRALDAAE